MYNFARDVVEIDVPGIRIAADTPRFVSEAKPGKNESLSHGGDVLLCFPLNERGHALRRHLPIVSADHR